MTLFNKARSNQFNNSIHEMRDRKEATYGSDRSVAVPIKILKDSGASCSNCIYFLHHGYLTICTHSTKEKGKQVKRYNICTLHSPSPSN